MAHDVPSFGSLLELEPHGHDAYVGVSPTYPWGRVYGGQVVAQALRAAADTVDGERLPHSLHAYFIRGGDFDEPIRFEVDRIRNGRSFATRRVVARQAAGAILNLSASFQVVEDQPDSVETAMDASAEAPSDGGEVIWSPLLRRQWHSDDQGSSRSAAWLKLVDDLGGDPLMHACGLAYLSDDIPTMSVAKSHPADFPDHLGGHDEVLHSASLDHAIWFHRHGRADSWQLHDFGGYGVSGGRGLSTGEIFAADGTHLATVAQEVLMRKRRSV